MANGLRSELLERHAVLQSASRIEEIVRIFIHATKVYRISLRQHVNGARLLGYLVNLATDGNWFLGDVPILLEDKPQAPAKTFDWQ